MSGGADFLGWHSLLAVTTDEELILTCGGLVVALSPTRVQRVGDRVDVLVRSMFDEIVEGSIVLSGLVGEGCQFHAVAGVCARDDQLVMGG